MLQNYRGSIFCDIILVIMSKQKKKRNKKYTGADAAATRPTITRVQAVNRGKLGQWLFENQKMLKMIRNVSLIGLVIAIIVSGIISLF